MPPGGLVREAEQFLPLALPAVLWRLLVVVVLLAPASMLVPYGVVELGRLGLAASLALPAWLVGVVRVSSGAAVFGATASGALPGQRRVGALWRQAMRPAVSVGLLAAVMAMVLVGSLHLWPGALKSPLLNPAGHAAGLLLLAVLPGLVALLNASILRAIGRTVVLALAAALALVQGVAMMVWQGEMVLQAGVSRAVWVGWSLLATLTVAAMALSAALWWLPAQARYGLRRSRSSDWSVVTPVLDHAAARDAAVLLAGPVLAAAMAMALAGELGALPLAALGALGLVLAPLAAIAWGLVDAAVRRLAQARLAAEARPGALGRTASRCRWLVAVPLLLGCALYASASRDLLPLLLPKGELPSAVARLLPVGLALLAVEAFAWLHAGALHALGVRRQPLQVQWLGAIAGLPVGWLMAEPAHLGALGLLLGMLAAAGVRLVLLVRHWARCAGLTDAASAEAARQRAQAIAHGWADTVVLATSRRRDRRRDAFGAAVRRAPR